MSCWVHDEDSRAAVPVLGGEAVAFLRAAGAGPRVVIRYFLPGGNATDALGVILATDDLGCVVETRRGPERVEFSTVIAAKSVPPPPPRRRPHLAAGTDATPDVPPAAPVREH